MGVLDAGKDRGQEKRVTEDEIVRIRWENGVTWLTPFLGLLPRAVMVFQFDAKPQILACLLLHSEDTIVSIVKFPPAMVKKTHLGWDQ